MSTSFIDSKFASLSGLTTAMAHVRRIAGQPHTATAVLLYGPEGAGKGALARILAQCWLCREPQDGLACGACPSCIAVGNELNADLLAMEPGGPGDQIRVGAISDGRGDPKKDPYSVQRFLRTMPIQSRTKVVILEDCHRMNDSAQNAILKSLEEPEPYVRFILTTTRLSAVSATIRSRCAAVGCGAPDDRGTDGLRLSPGVRAKFGDRQAFLDSICAIAKASLVDTVAAIRNAESFRDLVGEFKDEDDGSTRESQLDALALLAEAYRALGAFGAAKLTVEAHRRVRANGHFALVTDALLARISVQGPESYESTRD